MTGPAVYLVLSVAVGVSLAADLTLSPGADGKIVVDAVIDRIRSKCIFGDDRLFLRRLAYVETSDGEESRTYRPGYNGGIWQIDEDKFNLTQSCSQYIRAQCDIIQSEFNINWRNATWEDLRKPLYSGLAASLYIKYRSGSHDTPANVTSQATFWKRYMRSGGDTSAFTTKARNLPGMDCKTEMDLAFIVDGSGSVSSTDYDRMLTFINDVIDSLNINEDEIQVSALEFSTTVGDMITFNSFTTKAALKSSILRMRKGNSGTATHLAIQEAGDTLFNTSTGARPNAKRVAILLTDGASSYRNYTVFAAQKARDLGHVLLSVGVGSINEVELASIASKPNCTHVFVLNNFLEIDSLLYQLKE
ncbi:LOW QUALITY PROTEIN: integrin alpha-1-like [Haliotis rubra]|uniref:LOW QUALITY PROTEIN: integrin alpha-1-like n=1 Tax=Haliotis rubra TaxID=36100 RepID=UPI001EE56AA8|nr:LOW QUALITY PROTEIN: integrin alpha-1-like [Haliotis rubra]